MADFQLWVSIPRQKGQRAEACSIAEKKCQGSKLVDANAASKKYIEYLCLSVFIPQL